MSDHETTLRDSEKVLRLIGSPCPKNAQGHDHEWHTCPRCEMLHELEMRDSLARKLVLAGADALVRLAALSSAPPDRRINTRCPSCGSSTLFLDAHGHLVCSLIGCKQPVVERAIEALLAREREAIAAYIESFREDDTDRPTVQVFDVLAKHIRARAYKLVQRSR